MASLSNQNATLVEMLKQAGVEHEAQIVSARIQGALTAEIHHRMKNMLTMVAAIVRQTMRGAASLAEAEKSISVRLLAMSRAHDVLLKLDTRSASLTGIVGGAMEQHVATAAHVSITGEEMDVNPAAVLPLALILNELSTNATKYGALSSEAGRVSLRWTCDCETDSFFLWWEEKGGPPVAAPRDRGFGSRLLECAIPGQLGGEGHLSFPLTGVRYALRAKMAKIAWRESALEAMAG
ncbi:MAG TPA: sensor histidine kinase [Rhizomicrobium sp.]|nr:sensor histidine kinase [Rhizomicrobium sp.]